MNKHALQLLTLGLAETIATAMLLFFGCMGCVNLGGNAPVPNHLTIVLGFGLVVMFIVNIFGMISGSHLNPAVTLAAYIYKLVDLPTAVVYCVGQLIGGYFGYALLRAITPSDAFEGIENSFCMTLPSVNIYKAFWIEFFMTMALIMICYGVWDQRNANHHDSVPLRFGLAISGLALVGGPYSGGSMNPARSFGPALYNMNFTSHWIYWAAPLASALITAVAFKAVFSHKQESPVQSQITEETVRLNEVKSNTRN